MEKELTKIFLKTMPAHFDPKYGLSQDEYLARFRDALSAEIPDAPRLDVEKGNLAVYLKLSVLVLAMVRLYESMGMSEAAIGEAIYRTADRFYRLSPLKRRLRRKLFFSRLNRKQILKRERLSDRSANGINGFKIALAAGSDADSFGVDYLRCGICDYFQRKNRFAYVKYCCLVDYAIMKNLGVSFSRTTTLGNGGAKCDFRFSKSGPIAEGWPPDHLKEFRR